MKPLLDRRLLVVTGKGGTGKTLVAAGLARSAARANKRVLLCEVDRCGDIAEVFGAKSLGFEPSEVEPNLFAMEMDTEAALSEYLRLNLKVPLSLRMGPFAKAFDFVATAAPGVREVLTIGKLCWEVKRDNWDVVIVDAPSSGHVVGQLDSPQAIGGLVDVGPLAGQTKWMRDILTDPERMGAVVVTTAEEVPVSETIELVGSLETRTSTPLGAVVVNRTFPEVMNKAERTSLGDIRSTGSAPTALLEAADLAMSLRSEQLTQIERLNTAIPLRPYFVPQCFESLEPKAVLDHVANALALEVAP